MMLTTKRCRPPSSETTVYRQPNKINTVKKFISFLFLCCLTYTSYTQEVVPIQHTMVTKVTASWCFNCGTWGWAAKNAILEANSEQALFISAHNSGDLRTSTASALSQNFNSFGQPQFFLNNTNTRLSPSNRSDKQAEILATIQTNAMQTPVAGTATTHQISDDVLQFSTKVAFFQDMDGDYFLAHYLLENNVMNRQIGQDGIVAHNKVLREVSTREPFGMPIATNGMTTTQDVILSEDWNINNLEVLSIIWKQEGNKYQFVNGSISKPERIDNSTSMEEVEETEMEEVATEEETIDTPEEEVTEEEMVEEEMMEEETPEEEVIEEMAEEETAESTSSEGPMPMGEAPDFPEFPWLSDLLDAENCCDHSGIIVYNSGAFQFVYIEGDESCSENMGTLYFQSGQFYCSDSPSMDCRAAYNLTEVAKTWTCAAPNEDAAATEEESTEMEPSEEIEEINLPDFEEFLWLYDLVSTENCCDNTRVIAYYSGIYTYLFIEADDSCSDQSSQLYFQDGTFYCTEANGMDCRGAYELSAERSRVLWNCAN